MNKDKVLVSVCMMAYNIELYIEEAIKGVLAQRIEGKIELIIADDASIDGTASICKTYAARYPDTIRYYQRTENVGVIENWLGSLKLCTGRYIARCDGDDYWTEPDKLEKQISILEANPQFSVCFHDALDLYSNGEFATTTYCQSLEKNVYTISDVSNFLNIPASSILFRNLEIKIPDNFKELPIDDWPYLMLLANKGSLYYLNEVMSIYRKHETARHSLKPAFIQNGYKVKALEIVTSWFKTSNALIFDILQKQLCKSYYYQSILYLKAGNKKEAQHFYKNLLTNIPWDLGLSFKVKYPIKYFYSKIR